MQSQSKLVIPSYFNRYYALWAGLFFGSLMAGLVVATLWPDQPIDLYHIWPFDRIAMIAGLDDAYEAHALSAEAFNGLFASLILFLLVGVLQAAGRVCLEVKSAEKTRPAPGAATGALLLGAALGVLVLVTVQFDELPRSLRGLKSSHGIVPNAMKLGLLVWLIAFCCAEVAVQILSYYRHRSRREA